MTNTEHDHEFVVFLREEIAKEYGKEYGKDFVPNFLSSMRDAIFAAEDMSDQGPLLHTPSPKELDVILHYAWCIMGALIASEHASEEEKDAADDLFTPDSHSRMMGGLLAYLASADTEHLSFETMKEAIPYYLNGNLDEFLGAVEAA